ncbi:MAG: hypothetical protein COY39_04630 [Alphaproteobacteria bacterium CG_4_10_14_0_8_um_filter_37_21]|nr:MAG: hypothetical protein COY39_04630 [Alphaproteobacteria bacterium CG_4_10_14_0_8_um_filter_37_21]
MPESKIEKIELLPNQSSRYKGSLKNTVFKSETGGIDALVELKKSDFGTFITLPLNEAGQLVFVKFMQEGDRLVTDKVFMLTHPDKMFAKSPVKLAEVKEGNTVFQGVLTPVK